MRKRRCLYNPEHKIPEKWHKKRKFCTELCKTRYHDILRKYILSLNKGTTSIRKVGIKGMVVKIIKSD